MKRTTLFIDEGVEHELHLLAQRKQVPVSALVRESLEQYLAEQRRQGLSLRFLGQGHSGQQDGSERHEELLWQDLDPHRPTGRRRGPGRA